MTFKEKSYKEQNNEKTRGKKKYLERVVEDKEAEEEIKNYEPETSLFPENDAQKGIY